MFLIEVLLFLIAATQTNHAVLIFFGRFNGLKDQYGAKKYAELVILSPFSSNEISTIRDDCLMLLEAAVGTAVSFLFSRLENKAETKDSLDAINKALEVSIDESFTLFSIKHADFSDSFLDKELLEKNICPEIHKLLSRNEIPDTEAVVKALPSYVVLSDENSHRNEIDDFFSMVMDSMKKHPVLQEIINRRQIEETNQRLKNIESKQDSKLKMLEEKFDEIDLGQKDIQENTRQIISQRSESLQAIAHVASLLNERLPSSKGNELNKLLTKQLDKARDLIDSGQVNEAKSLLDIIEDEVSESDEYTRFRWHTNQAACFLLDDLKLEAAEHYFTAYNFAKNEEKAIANRIRAFLLIGELNKALELSENAIELLPESDNVWALHINTKSLLNIEFNPSILSEELLKSVIVLLTLSDVKNREKKFQESYRYAQKAIRLEDNSDAAKRALLASALSWATTDKIKSHFRQMRNEQREALTEAIESFNDIITYLKSLQSKHVFIEVAQNLILGAELTDNEQLKKKLTTYAFSIYPDEETFIWYRVKDLKASGDIEAIRNLTDDKLNTLTKPLLFIIAEEGANIGDIKWVETILQILNTRDINERDSEELFGLKLFAIWKSGDKSSATKLASENLKLINSSPSLLALYTRMLDEIGDIKSRDKLLITCKKLPKDASSYDIFQTADLLFDFEQYPSAAQLYLKLLEEPSDDYLTKRYLESLINSKQRSKALSVLEQLTTEIRNTSQFKRIEANLARASGDLDKLERILSEELKSYPFDSYIAVGYVATLYQKNQLEKLSIYLSDSPTFEPIIEQNEIEIAKYQMELRLEQQALLRAYILFRVNTGSSKLAGHFLLLMLLAKNFDQLKGLKKVTVSTVILLKSAEESKRIVIEPKDLIKAGWAECISEESELAKSLLGKAVGDIVSIDGGLVLKQWQICSIDSMFIFASAIAQNVVASSASTAGPIWSVNLKKTDGEFDFSSILESLKTRSQHVEHVFSVYRDKKLPLPMLAEALGTDLVTLLLEWPSKKYDLFVSSGNHEERDEIKELILKDDNPFVVDLSCLIILHSLGLLKESLQVFGKPLIATSTRSSLLGIIQTHKSMKPSGIASETNGELQFKEIPQSYLDERSLILEDLMTFIDDFCDVVPVIGPENVTEKQVALEQYIGIASNDTILLARERNAILVSEDGGFRNLATNMEVASSSWLQPILMIMRDKKIVLESQYSEAILNKLESSHSFTSIAPDDLLWAARECPEAVSPKAESAIASFKTPTLDLVSGVGVSAHFLGEVAKYVSPKALYDYYKLTIESLTHERHEHHNEIHLTLRQNIVFAMSQLEKTKARLISKKFGHLLDAPPPRRFQVRLNPLTKAIRLAISEL